MNKTIHPHFSLFSKRLFFCLLIFLAVIQEGQAQNRLEQYVDSARVNDPNIIQLQKQIQLLELGKKAIRASYQAPTGFISSEVNLTPYFNNHGQLFSTNPDPNAIGYDINISNGGLYSALMNVNIPLFAGKATHQALFQQDSQIEVLKTSLLTANLNLERQITDLYLSTLAVQMSYTVQQQRVQQLSQEVQVMKQLTRKGMYRLVDYELLKTTLAGDSIQLHSLANTYQMQLMQLRSTCGITDSTLVFLKNTEITLSQANENESLFLLPYDNDSLSAVADNLLFNNKYLPQFTLYSNAGLNAVALNGMERKFGASAGIRLSYTLFDGKQKAVNQEQKMVRIEQAHSLKYVESKRIRMQRALLLKTIAKADVNLHKQKDLKENYQKLMKMYRTEVQKGQVRISNYLLALRNYSNLKLNYELQKIKVYRLINEYNYWNH
ncbi:MAG: TolC family protein [Bacteroidales bacterium]|nr:TolC family protein [Bacteroidales bacterium]